MALSCSICDRKFATLQTLTIHASTFHPKPNQDGGDSLCSGEKTQDGQISNRPDRQPVCAFPYPAWPWTFQCPTCGRAFKSKASLSSHKSDFHTKRDTADRRSEEGIDLSKSSRLKDISQKELDESQVHTPTPIDSDNTPALSPGHPTNEPCSANRTIIREQSMLGRRRRRRRRTPTRKRKLNEMKNSDRRVQVKRLRLSDEDQNGFSDNHTNIELVQQTCEHPTVVTPTLGMLASYKIKREVFENLVPRVFTTEQHMKSTMSEEQLLLIDAVLSVYSLSEIRRLLNENRELLLGIIAHIETAIFMDN